MELPANVDRRFYDECCNTALWPLLHGLLDRCLFTDSAWSGYVEANRLFAAQAFRLAARDPAPAYLVQDFHFALVPRMIRGIERAHDRSRSRISLYWHVPWPEPGAMEIFPWLDALLEGVCSADVLFFQTPQDEVHFRALFRGLGAHRGIRLPRIEVLGAALFPEAPPDGPALKDGRPDSPLRILGVDRIDYTKGLLHKIRAFAHFAERNPHPARPIELVQIGAPCRENTPSFQQYRRELEELITRTKGTLPRGYRIDWRPWTHSHEELLRLSRDSHAGWVTPLRDGMNLFAQEYLLAQDPRDPGALVLSRFAGVAHSLQAGAIAVNPWHLDSMAEGLEEALFGSREGRRRRHVLALGELARLEPGRWGERLIAATLSSGEAEGRKAPLKIASS